MTFRLPLVALLCCAFLVHGSGGVATASATASSTGSVTRSSTGSADDINKDTATARYVVDRFWAARWSRIFDGRYRSPNIFGGYGKGWKKPPFCGKKRLDYENAWYCRQGDYIAWDIALMRSGYRSGDSWVYLIVAHEWGHAVQARLHPSLVLRARELQADCLAGAALYGAAADGTLRFERGDVEELGRALRRLADDYDWTDVSDHGSPKQRIAAFNQGARHGVRGCLPG